MGETSTTVPKAISSPVELLRELEAYLSFRLTADVPSIDKAEMRNIHASINYCLNAIKDSGEPVKYGCHYNNEVVSECAIDTKPPLCIAAKALAENGLKKERCSYWRPIK